MPSAQPSIRPVSDVASRAELLRVGLTGLNAWLVVVLAPTLHAGFGDAWGVALVLLPLPVLLAGVALLSSRPSLARDALLGLFPPTLGATLAVRADAAAEAHDAVTVGLAAVSLLAFVASAAHASARPRRLRPTSLHPLVGKEPVAEPAPRRWLRRALLGVTVTGALAIAVLAPALAGRQARAAAWGDAAADGAAFTAVVAAIVGSLALGAVVGPGLRAERRRPPSAPSRRRAVAGTLVLAAAAAAGWLALAHFDAR